MNQWTIYGYRSKSTNKWYVGLTFLSRKAREGRLMNGYENYDKNNNPTQFWNAIQTQGHTDFEYYHFATATTLNEALRLEKLWELRLDSYANGYNSVSCGQTRGMSKQQRKKISEANKGKNNYWYGKKLSKSHKQKLSMAKLGKKRKPEHIEKTAKANTGKKRSQETRNRMSKAQKGKIFKPKHRQKLRIAWERKLEDKIGIPFNDFIQHIHFYRNFGMYFKDIAKIYGLNEVDIRRWYYKTLD